MKLSILLIFLCHLSILQGQNTWNTLIYNNDDGQFTDLIKTQDGNYLTTLRRHPQNGDLTEDSTWLIKFNDLGDTLWKKYIYTGDSMRVRVTDVFEENNQIILFGAYGHFFTTEGSFYMYKLTTDGDSLGLINLSIGVYEVEKYNQNYWVYNSYLQSSIYEIDNQGIPLDSIPLNNQEYYSIEIVDDYLFVKDGSFTGNTLQKFDLATKTLLNSYSANPGTIIVSDVNSEYLYINYYNGSLLNKYDSDGVLVWSADGSDYGVNNIHHNLHSMKETADGGVVLAGLFYNSGFAAVYIVKYREDGTLDWYRYLTNTPLSFIYGIVEADDGGFVFTGKTNVGNWIVKVDNQGLFTNTFEPENTEQHLTNTIQLFPNPTQHILNVQSDSSLDGIIQIYNSVGQIVLEQSILQSYTTSITVNHLPNGVYYLRLLPNDNSSYITKKWIKFVR